MRASVQAKSYVKALCPFQEALSRPQIIYHHLSQPSNQLVAKTLLSHKNNFASIATMSGPPRAINRMSCSNASSNNPYPNDASSPPHTGIHLDTPLSDVTPLELDFSPYLSTHSSPSASHMTLEDLEVHIADDESVRVNILRSPTPHGEINDMELPILVSRYANLGLNRVPARRPACSATHGRKIADENDSTQATPPSDKFYPHLAMDNEDLAQLENMMMPGESSSSVHNTCSNRQSINVTRASKYTTGILNTWGWQPSNNNSRPTGGIMQAINQANTFSKEDSVPISPSDYQDGDEIHGAEEHDKTTSRIWLDDKYFDHYGYLNHIKDESAKITDMSKTSATMPGKSLKKLPKKEAQIKPAAISNNDPMRTYTQEYPSPLDPNNAPEVSKRTKSHAGSSKAIPMPGNDDSETTSDAAGKWELCRRQY